MYIPCRTCLSSNVYGLALSSSLATVSCADTHTGTNISSGSCLHSVGHLSTMSKVLDHMGFYFGLALFSAMVVPFISLSNN